MLEGFALKALDLGCHFTMLDLGFTVCLFCCVSGQGLCS